MTFSNRFHHLPPLTFPNWREISTHLLSLGEQEFSCNCSLARFKPGTFARDMCSNHCTTANLILPRLRDINSCKQVRTTRTYSSYVYKYYLFIKQHNYCNEYTFLVKSYIIIIHGEKIVYLAPEHVHVIRHLM